MRITNSQTVARPDFLDRNPTFGGVGYQVGAVAPHAVTIRASSVVPAGKKYRVEAISLMVRRNAAAAPPGIVNAYIQHTLALGGSIVHVMLQTLSNVVADEKMGWLGQTGGLNVGDTLQVVTADSSTGGTVDYAIFCKFTSGDA